MFPFKRRQLEWQWRICEAHIAWGPDTTSFLPSMASARPQLNSANGCQSNVNLDSIGSPLDLPSSLLPHHVGCKFAKPHWLKVAMAFVKIMWFNAHRGHLVGRTQWLHGYYFSPRTLSVQTTVSHTPKPMCHLQTLSLTSSSRQCFHQTEWSFSGRRSHLRLEGRSTCLPKISWDIRCQNTKKVFAFCSQWQTHQTSQKRKSKLYKFLSKPQKRIQGAAITTDIRNRPQQLQRSSPEHSTSSYHSADDPSTEMLPPEWIKFFSTKIAPAGRGGRTMIWLPKCN